MKVWLAASCGAVLTAAVLAAPAQAIPSYGSNGVFAVDPAADPGWATAFIPPGRYRVEQAPSMAPYQSAPGFWVRCRAYPCGPGFGGNVIARGDAVRGVTTFMDVVPGDTAVFLANTTLIPA